MNDGGGDLENFDFEKNGDETGLNSPMKIHEDRPANNMFPSLADVSIHFLHKMMKRTLSKKRKNTH